MILLIEGRIVIKEVLNLLLGEGHLSGLHRLEDLLSQSAELVLIVVSQVHLLDEILLVDLRGLADALAIQVDIAFISLDQIRQILVHEHQINQELGLAVIISFIALIAVLADP